jgi:MFS family permease
MVYQATEWLLVTRFVTSLAGAMAVGGSEALLRMVLSKESLKLQKGNASFKASMGVVGTSLGNLMPRIMDGKAMDLRSLCRNSHLVCGSSHRKKALLP